jgi:GH24 family phage-related lysozyme (muramidase)
MRQINQDGFDKIKSFEGIQLSAYQDVVGVWIIEYGRTNAALDPIPADYADDERWSA